MATEKSVVIGHDVMKRTSPVGDNAFANFGRGMAMYYTDDALKAARKVRIENNKDAAREYILARDK